MLEDQPVDPADLPEVTVIDKRDHVAELLVRGGYRLEVVARTHGRDSQQYAEVLDTWSGIIRNEANVRAEF
jgi:hypothetical protein